MRWCVGGAFGAVWLRCGRVQLVRSENPSNKAVVFESRSRRARLQKSITHIPRRRSRKGRARHQQTDPPPPYPIASGIRSTFRLPRRFCDTDGDLAHDRTNPQTRRQMQIALKTCLRGPTARQAPNSNLVLVI